MSSIIQKLAQAVAKDDDLHDDLVSDIVNLNIINGHIEAGDLTTAKLMLSTLTSFKELTLQRAKMLQS